jgi:hypothetical protein
MRRRAVEDLVLGQPTFTTTSRAQRQLCGNAAYSHSRPPVVVHADCPYDCFRLGADAQIRKLSDSRVRYRSLKVAAWRDRFTFQSRPSRRSGRIVVRERLLLADVTGSIRPQAAAGIFQAERQHRSGSCRSRRETHAKRLRSFTARAARPARACG